MWIFWFIVILAAISMLYSPERKRKARLKRMVDFYAKNNGYVQGSGAMPLD